MRTPLPGLPRHALPLLPMPRLALLRLLPFLLLLSTWAGPAPAQALRLPPPPAAAFAPPAGARLPLDAMVRDQQGRQMPLGRLFGRSPVVLVPGYYTCPNLCSTVFEGVLQALALSGLGAGEYRLLGLSLDPRDGRAEATARQRAYAWLLPGGAADLDMLTADAPAAARIAAALGYRIQPDPGSGQLAHAAGFAVLDAGGRIRGVFGGVRFDPAALRGAVREAARPSGSDGAGRDAPVPSLGEQLLMLCAHYDPAAGRYTGTAMAAVRAGALALPLLLAAWLWRRRGRGGRP
jgi:protein SCO1/2